MVSITSEEFFILSTFKLLFRFDEVSASIPSFEMGNVLKEIGDSYVVSTKSLEFC